MVLRRLCEASGISGREHEVRDIIKRELEGVVDEMRSDTIGNLVFRKGPKEGPRVMLAAHMDEVGLMVSHIEKSGALRFRKVGGIDDRVLLAKQVLVGAERVPGVVGAMPIHLQKPGERDKPIDSERLYIDIGAASKEEASEKVKLGDAVVFATSYADFGDGYMKAKALDDRVGCAVIVDILKEEWSIPVYGVFTVQEEIGMRGATVAAYAVNPDIGLVLEGTVCADLPGVEEHLEATRLGDGPAISVMDASSIPNPALRAQIEKLAKEAGISFQHRRATSGGNDGGRISQTRAGVPTAAISVPCRNLHAPVSIASKSDFKNTIKLVKTLLHSVERGFRP